MYFLIPIPIILVALIVRYVVERFKLEIFKKVSSAVIILGVLVFIFLYVQYYGFDNIMESLKKFFDMKIK